MLLAYPEIRPSHPIPLIAPQCDIRLRQHHYNSKIVNSHHHHGDDHHNDDDDDLGKAGSNIDGDQVWLARFAQATTAAISDTPPRD